MNGHGPPVEHDVKGEADDDSEEEKEEPAAPGSGATGGAY